MVISTSWSHISLLKLNLRKVVNELRVLVDSFDTRHVILIQSILRVSDIKARIVRHTVKRLRPNLKRNQKLKSGSHLPKKLFLFASMKAVYKIKSKKLFISF